MSVAEMPYHMGPGGSRVRDLLRRCATTGDRAERAAMLDRVADELDRAAEEALAHDHSSGSRSRELAAGLQGQAGMARFFAELERQERARHAAQRTRSAG